MQLKQLRDMQFEPVKLPPFYAPVVLSAPQVTISDVRFVQEQSTLLHVLTLGLATQLNQHNFQVDVYKLHTKNSQTTVSLKTDNRYQLALQLNTSGDHGQLQLDVSGAPSAIEITGNLDGHFQDVEVAGDFQLQTNLTDAALPIVFDSHIERLLLPQLGTINRANLQLTGVLDKFQLKAHAALATPWWSDVALDLYLTGSPQKTDIQQLKLSSVDGNIDANGTIDLNRTPQLALQVKGTNINLASHIPRSEALLNLDSDIALSVIESSWQVDSETLNLTSSWYQHMAKLSARLRYNSAGSFALDNLQVVVGDNTLTGDLQLDESGVLQGNSDIRLSDLAQLHPKASGNMVANINVQGPLRQPAVVFQSEGANLAFEQYGVAHWQSDVALAWTAESPFRIDVQAQQIQLADELALDLAMNSTGNAAAHSVDFRILSDWLQIEAQLNGALDNHRWFGQLLSSEVHRNDIVFSLARALNVSLDWQNHEYQLASGCWLNSNAARFCIEQLSYAHNQFKGALLGEALPLITWFKGGHRRLKQLQTDSLFDFSVALEADHYGLSALSASGDFTPATWQFFDEEQRFFVNKLGYEARLQDGQFKIQTEFQSDALGQIAVHSSLPMTSGVSQIDLQQMQMTARVSRFELSPWAFLVPRVEKLKGVINSELEANFHSQKLAIYGDLSLSEAGLVNKDLGLDITSLNQHIAFDGNSLQTSGQFSLGNGPATLTGRASWIDGGTANFKIQGQKLTYDDNLMAQLSVSPDLDIALSESEVKVSGKLVVPQANVKIKSIPEAALKPTTDIRLPDVSTTSSAKGPILNLDLELLLDPQKNKTVNLDAFGLTTALTGNLAIRGNGNITAIGEVSLLDGTYKAYGQNLLIRQGDLLFNGPVEFPTLQIEAVREPQVTSDDVVAGLRVTGPARQPQVTVFSLPEMAQSQALSYLLTGRALGARSNDSQETTLTNALISYGLNQSENVVAKLGKNLGVKDLSLAMEGQGDSSKVAVSGTIAPNVKLTYGVGVFDAVSEVALRYQVLPQLYLEAVSGLSNALDVFYEFTYEPEEKAEEEQ